MRALLLVLLLANLTIFAYTRLNGDANAPVPGDADSTTPVPRLALVGEGAPSAARCATIGPFSTQAGAQRGAAWLLGAHHGSRLHSADAPGPSSYWVAIKTKTLQDATRIGLRLRAAGVTDLVITPPEAGGTEAIVSLGIFSDRDRADRRVLDLRRYAVTPVIIEQPHLVTTWWLDVQTASGESTPDVGALGKAAGEAGSLRAAACPAAATPAPTTTGAPAATGDAAGQPNAPAPAAAAAKPPGKPA
jgi:hypothetical protein